MSAIDYSRYDYVKLGNYKNVMVRWDKGEVQRPVTITSFISPLIDKLALYHGNWTIIGDAMRWRDDVHVFNVFEDGEYIGYLAESNHRGSKAVHMTSHTIDRSLWRGRYKTTGDLKKAYKIIKDNFVTLGFEDRASAVSSRGRAAMTNAAHKLGREMNDIYDKLRSPLLCYLYHNIASVGPALEGFGADAHLVNSFRAAYTEMKVGQQGKAAVDNGTGVTVVPHKDRFLVCASKQEPVLMTQTELPDPLRTKMAMLKLMDQDNVILEDVGIRTDGNIYYIMV
jgi:hypothetical protein